MPRHRRAEQAVSRQRGPRRRPTERGGIHALFKALLSECSTQNAWMGSTRPRSASAPRSWVRISGGGTRGASASADAMKKHPTSRVACSRRPVVFMTSPWKTIARRTWPTSPAMTSPRCRAARSSGCTPKRWTNRFASAASAARIAKKQRSARASATPSASTQVTTISSPTYW